MFARQILLDDQQFIIFTLCANDRCYVHYKIADDAVNYITQNIHYYYCIYEHMHTKPSKHMGFFFGWLSMRNVASVVEHVVNCTYMYSVLFWMSPKMKPNCVCAYLLANEYMHKIKNILENSFV